MMGAISRIPEDVGDQRRVETEGTRSGGMLGSDLEKDLIARAQLGRTGKVGDIAPIAALSGCRSS